ncbi:MAG: hypothetical protein JO061_05185 [Acidobacteriaceae bacterium]|nr:hypothetical protein [Acidobacteriaceae bacterium]
MDTFRFTTNLQIWSAALVLCATQSYGQGLQNPRLHPFGTIRAAGARTLAAQAGQLTTAATLPEARGTFISFDAPGACATATFPGCTEAVAINAFGEILGYSVDANGNPHGFLRDWNGKFTTFDVPGATAYAAVFSEGPPGSTLNLEGDATGGYLDANGVPHGFIRDRQGAITTFDPPGAVNGTIPLSINVEREVTGYYLDAGFFAHGFLRDARGNLTTFDAPGAGTVSTGCFFGLTFPNAINDVGEITGNYYDPQCFSHGFLREPNGHVAVIDVPEFADGTSPGTNNDLGEVAGSGLDATAAFHWFVRDRSGSVAIFDTPDVRDGGTVDINLIGTVAGNWLDSNLTSHSFRRTPDGVLTSIDFPGAATGNQNGTYAYSINPEGVIAGAYTDANGVFHGFLFLPRW